MATLRITSDGDPHPVKAGDNLVNDGFTSRQFFNNAFIADQRHDFSFTYRAGSSTRDPHPVDLNQPIGIAINGVTIYSSGSPNRGIESFGLTAPTNFTWNTVALPTDFPVDPAGGRPEENGEYRYRNCSFYKAGMLGNSVFVQSSQYLSQSTNFGSDKLRHEDGHSKILGYAFDGYPIYGPYGYVDVNATPDIGGTAPDVTRMRSSYVLRDQEADGRVYSYTQVPRGSFIEDYRFVSNLPTGTLDEHNGRTCTTPDYPNGTYAYFLTFTDGDLNIPEYPYVIGPSTRERRTA